MAISPIVRYMLLCDDWRLDGQNNRRVTIIGLIWNIRSVGEPPYPLFYREFCMFLALQRVGAELDRPLAGLEHLLARFLENADDVPFPLPPTLREGEEHA